MAIYNVTFAGDWGWIGTTVDLCQDEDEAEDKAREWLILEAEIPSQVICIMPHVEVEYLGLDQELSNETDVSSPDHTLYNDAYHPTPE